MSKTLKWQDEAASEIIDALREESERVAYYASGQGDGWARSYGAGNFRHPDYAAIIAKHFLQMKAQTKIKKRSVRRTTARVGSNAIVGRVRSLRRAALKQARRCVASRMEAENNGDVEQARDWDETHSAWCSYLRALEDVMSA